MKKTLIKLTALFIAFCIILMTATSTHASGTTNDVTTHSDGDVLFLTTTATHSATITKETTKKSYAQSLISLTNTIITIPPGFATNISDLINALLSVVMLIGALLVFVQLILAGLYWITSGGDKGKTDAARQRLMAAIVGLIILASSFAILNIGLNFLGFESLNEVFKNTKTIS